MNILLVDDDIYVVEALQKSIDWDYLQIENVYIAHSVGSARKIMEDIPIQVLVCDIEMPKEDGFELLKWIREKKYIIKEILLTSYAEFEYANKAVNLNCFAYALKPVDFEELQVTIGKAMEAEKEALQAGSYKKYYEFWSKTERIRKEQFWEELLIKNSLNEMKDIQEAIHQNGLRYSLHNTFSILILEYTAKEKDYKGYNKGMFEWSLRNVVAQTFRTIHMGVEGIFPTPNARILVIMQEQDLGDRDELQNAASLFIQKANKRLDILCSVVIGDICSFQSISSQTQVLLEKCEKSIINGQRILLAKDYEYEPMTYKPPDFVLWKDFVLNRKEAFAANEINNYLEGLRKKPVLEKEIPERLVLDYMQMMTDVLKQKNILLYHMDNPFFKVERINESLYSIDTVKQYMLEILHSVIGMSGCDGGAASVVKSVKEYIDGNLNQEITRETLARMVFLNQDYLARIFKKEVGESIGNYLVDKRIEAAKEYLVKTDEPVNMIAVKVGYDNFSYFTRVFKNSVGITPKEYRKQNSMGE